MMFPIQDEVFHRKVKKPIAKYYSMSSMTEYESLVDMVILEMIEKFQRADVGGTSVACQPNAVYSMDKWLQYCKLLSALTKTENE